MKRYDHRTIEAKWQRRWDDEQVFVVSGEARSGYAGKDAPAPSDLTPASGHPSPQSPIQSGRTGAGGEVYLLDMFPYPSSDGLHVGHPEGYTATDIVSRYLRMNGKNVLHPMGWDAFGLPAENAAIKKGVHPKIVTEQNVANFKRQIRSLGFSYDWSREVNTTDPKYYKWTQWIFLQLFKMGLAYEAEVPIWWCPKDKTGLANEEVVDGCCERCGTKVERKKLRQWLLKITKYADRLLAGLDKLDWTESIKTLQRNWIGRSEGTEVRFRIKDLGLKVDREVWVFTTRPDTLFGATYLVLAPEHELVNKITTPKQKKLVEKYVRDVSGKSDLERAVLEKDKTGVFTGAYAVNPVNNEKIPVWIADYVLMSYGTGAIMAVPGHDERDYEFAKKFKLPIRQVVAPYFEDAGNELKSGVKTVRRRSVYVLLRNPKNDAYACLDWGSFGWKTFLIGGVEDGEDLIEAAKREIREETGYRDVRFVGDLGRQVAAYYAAHKKENRLADAESFFFELKSEQRDQVSDEEQKKHKLVWKKRNDVASYITPSSMHHIWQTFLQKSTIYIGEGRLVNSEQFDDLETQESRKKIVAWLEKQGKAKAAVQYKLRDWVFSRQRYWGEPIPLVHCPDDGVVPVPEDQLPVLLPDVKKYKPTGTGESPLAGIKEWVNVSCPRCGEPAKRETNTMPQWAGSCWYYLRYLDPKNDKALADPKKMKAWLPVDLYVGGAEHAVLHLLYARFWHMALYDAGVIPKECGDEPFMKLKNQGLILGEDGEKMSKSRGNVINPDPLIEKYGADSFRMYEMFMGPFEDAKPWSSKSIIGVRRFLDKVWRIGQKAQARDCPLEVVLLTHKTIKKVTEDIENFRFNTVVSSLMILTNAFDKLPNRPREEFENFLLLLEPFAPHIARELLEQLRRGNLKGWPTYDNKLIQDVGAITIAIQVNGKLRGTILMPSGGDQVAVESAAKAEPNVAKYVTSKPKKVIFVQDKLINFVV